MSKFLQTKDAQNIDPVSAGHFFHGRLKFRWFCRSCRMHSRILLKQFGRIRSLVDCLLLDTIFWWALISSGPAATQHQHGLTDKQECAFLPSPATITAWLNWSTVPTSLWHSALCLLTFQEIQRCLYMKKYNVSWNSITRQNESHTCFSTVTCMVLFDENDAKVTNRRKQIHISRLMSACRTLSTSGL